MKKHPFTHLLRLLTTVICTVLSACAGGGGGGGGVCKLVHHHIDLPNTKLTQRDDNIIASRIAISYLCTYTDTRESVLQR